MYFRNHNQTKITFRVLKFKKIKQNIRRKKFYVNQFGRLLQILYFKLFRETYFMTKTYILHIRKYFVIRKNELEI